jgi:hypothetical protein
VALTVVIVYGTEMGESRQGVGEKLRYGRLVIEPGTSTWRGGKNHRSSTIDLVIASNETDVSMAGIASDLYTGSDHETLCWEINEIGNTRDTGELRKIEITRWKIRQPLKNDDIGKEEKWREDWMTHTSRWGLTTSK